MSESDEEIYRRYLDESREEDFRILLERHRESLTLFLMGYVQSPEDAEEIMLDAYAEAAAGVGFSGRSSFKTWLFAVGKKMALMRVRKRHFLFASVEDGTELTVETAEPPEMEILREERNRQLYQALSGMNAEYRQVLILLYFEEMSIEDAERVIGKNRKQIYNLAERGRKALRQELERMGFDYAQYG